MKKKGFLNKLFGSSDEEEESFSDLNHEEKDMIRGVVELSETTVKEVMIPRIDVVFIQNDMTLDEILENVTESGHSRFPVYKDTIDNVIGILICQGSSPLQVYFKKT